MAGARCILFFISKNSLASDHCNRDDRVLITLASAYGHAGDADAAGRVMATLAALQTRRQEERSAGSAEIVLGIDVHLDGRYTLASVDMWPFKHTNDREKMREGLRLGGVPNMAPLDNPIPQVVEGATTVSREKARELFERGVQVVDVRGWIDRNIGYIPNSASLNLKNPTDFNKANLNALVDPDQEVLFHCEGMR